ncbi:MAG TPA: SUMF1/EgtB/PvdO family nonheme iron enzyme [Solirubrobacterales bacterium]|nr:SUMF1/EgtB/PvdO family nonheme iron enzyme [Solirubrobacterales bacterium]
MSPRYITPAWLILGAAVLLALTVVPVALAATDGGPPMTASAGVKKQLKKLKRQVADLQQKVDQLQTQPGPQGPQGPEGPQGQPGTSPACQGNGSGDVMVSAGSVCIDRYEASIWDAPTGGNQIIGAIPCNANGQNCTNVYARSVPGVTPRANITYFQAAQALANSGKRLPTSAEWQQAVAGTPDSTTCNVSTASVQSTGANPGCISNHGANDMVGNLDEWVADWVPASTACPGWGAFSDDLMCLSGASTTAQGPGALLRGGGFPNGSGAGPFAVHGLVQPSGVGANIGFRGVR